MTYFEKAHWNLILSTKQCPTSSIGSVCIVFVLVLGNFIVIFHCHNFIVIFPPLSPSIYTPFNIALPPLGVDCPPFIKP